MPSSGGVVPPGTAGPAAATPQARASSTSQNEPGDRWATYFEFSERLSELIRKLVLSGIALVWLFSGGSFVRADEVEIQGRLVWPLALLLAAAAVDLSQYVYLTVAHWVIAKSGERKQTSFDGTYPRWLAPPAEAMFWLKVALATVGWLWLLVSLSRQVL
jgi:hypothetical protein